MIVIEGTVLNGQLRFVNIPEGVAIHLKNYDNEYAPDSFVTEEKQAEEQLFLDESGWYHSHVFANLEDVEENSQLELPLPELEG